MSANPREAWQDYFILQQKTDVLLDEYYSEKEKYEVESIRADVTFKNVKKMLTELTYCKSLDEMNGEVAKALNNTFNVNEDGLFREDFQALRNIEKLTPDQLIRTNARNVSLAHASAKHDKLMNSLPWTPGLPSINKICDSRSLKSSSYSLPNWSVCPSVHHVLVDPVIDIKKHVIVGDTSKTHAVESDLDSLSWLTYLVEREKFQSNINSVIQKETAEIMQENGLIRGATEKLPGRDVVTEKEMEKEPLSDQLEVSAERAVEAKRLLKEVMGEVKGDELLRKVMLRNVHRQVFSEQDHAQKYTEQVFSRIDGLSNAILKHVIDTTERRVYEHVAEENKTAVRTLRNNAALKIQCVFRKYMAISKFNELIMQRRVMNALNVLITELGDGKKTMKKSAKKLDSVILQTLSAVSGSSGAVKRPPQPQPNSPPRARSPGRNLDRLSTPSVYSVPSSPERPGRRYESPHSTTIRK